MSERAADAQTSEHAAGLAHLDEAGSAHMVDVGSKDVSRREATARAVLQMAPSTARALADGDLPKGDALSVARVAGIMAAKRTADLVPLCHPVALVAVDLDLTVDAQQGTATVLATTAAADRTGVEMEAMTAAAVAALTLYDMVKGIERGVQVTDICLVSKSGGRSGTWRRGG